MVVVTLRVVRVRDDIKDVDFPVPSPVELELSWRLAVTARAAIITMEEVMTVLTHVMLCHVRRDHATTLSETTAISHGIVLNLHTATDPDINSFQYHICGQNITHKCDSVK